MYLAESGLDKRIPEILALTCSFVIGAPSEPPAPSKPKAGQIEQQKAAQTKEEPKAAELESSGAPKVKAGNSPSTQPGTSPYKYGAENEPTKDWWADPDWVMAFFTGILVLIAGLQLVMFWWQLMFMRKSTIAATAAAEALPLIERAYVYAKVVFDGPPFAREGDDVHSRVMAVFYNDGKTPALISQMRVLQDIFREPPEALQDFPGADRILSEGWAIGAGGKQEAPSDKTILKDQFTEIQQSVSFIFCYGLLKYQDVLGLPRETGFCWQYAHHRKQWIIADSKLNYCR